MEHAPPPDWLLRSPKPRPEVRSAEGVQQDAKRLRAAGEAAMQGEQTKLAAYGSAPGTGRHTALYASSCALGRHVGSQGLSMAEARAVLQQGAETLGLGWTAETAHQVEKGLADGLTEPYVLTERPMPAPANGTAAPAPPPAVAMRRARVRRAIKISVELVEWAWEQRVPLGKLTIMGGLAGQGKSQLTTWAAARWSTGTMPGELWGEAINVVLVSAEDDPSDTIVPRLLVAKADLSRVHIMDMREHHPDGTVTPSQVELPGDTAWVREAMEEYGARALVLDPISGLLDGDHSAYNSQQVRHALGPLKQAVEELRASCVLVTHVLPKTSGTDPLSRLADSHAFTGLPRSVLILGPDPDDDSEGDRGSRKVLTVAKSNVAGPGEHGLAFRLGDTVMVSDGAGGYGAASEVILLGPTSTTTAETLGGHSERSAYREAQEWLVEQLADGPKQAGTLQTGAQASGIAKQTLRRARERVCKRPYKRGPGPWWWELREDLPSHLEHLGQDGHLPDASRAGEGVQGVQGVQGGKVLPLFSEDDGLSDDTKPEEP